MNQFIKVGVATFFLSQICFPNSDPINQFGFGFHLGGGGGLGLNGFYGISNNLEVVPFLGLRVDPETSDDQYDSTNSDTVTAYTNSFISSIQLRYFPKWGFFVSSGISLILHEIVSNIKLSASNKDVTLRETKNVSVVEMVNKVGWKFRRNKSLGYYIDLGIVSQINNRNKIEYFDNLFYTARYKHKSDFFVTGIGMTLNFNDW